MSASTEPTPNPPQERSIVVRSGASPCFRRISFLSFCRAKTGSIGMPLTVILSRRYSEGFEVGACFVNRHEVLLVMMAEPHRMNVEVGDDDRLATGDALFGFEPRDNLSRQEVRADDHDRAGIRAAV